MANGGQILDTIAPNISKQIMEAKAMRALLPVTQGEAAQKLDSIDAWKQALGGMNAPPTGPAMAGSIPGIKTPVGGFAMPEPPQQSAPTQGMDMATLMRIMGPSAAPGLYTQARQSAAINAIPGLSASQRTALTVGGEPAWKQFSQTQFPELPENVRSVNALQSQLDALPKDDPRRPALEASLAKVSGKLEAAQNEETARHNRATEATGAWVDTRDAMGNPLLINKLSGDVKRPDGSQADMGETVDATAKMIANYELPPLSNTAMLKPFGQMTMKRVADMNPDYDAKFYNSAKSAKQSFASGKNGQLTRQANTATSHIITLEKLGEALDTGDVQAFNSIRNQLSSQFGGAAVDGYEAAAKMVGDEVNKFIGGGPGASADREDYSKALSAAKSPEQRKAVMNAIKALMVGQLNSLGHQYSTETRSKDFADKLEPEVADLLANPQYAVGRNPTVPVPGAGGQAAPVKLTADDAGKAVYAGLPSGSQYIDPKGVLRVKR